MNNLEIQIRIIDYVIGYKYRFISVQCSQI